MSRRERPPAATPAGPVGGGEPAPGAGADPRTVRVVVAPATWLEDDPAVSVAPPPGPALPLARDGEAATDLPIVDGVVAAVWLYRFDEGHGRVERVEAGITTRTDVLFGPIRRDPQRGTTIREVVVDGWRIEVEIEPERRALLREQVRRGAGAAFLGGLVEVRAIIPGRVVTVSVQEGDAVEAGQQILVVEAMKMQNELRAPREGSVGLVGVAVGDTIEVGDLLVVIH